MQTAISDDELDGLINFIGYGRIDARTWFLGMEEAGGGEENLRTRCLFSTVEDCAEAHLKLGIEKHHWGKKSIQSTWRGMCYVMLALEGSEINPETIRAYQADFLGRSHGTTLLVELLPIPRPRIKSNWGYYNLIPQFVGPHDYVDVIKPRRIEYLGRIIANQQPELVVGYGKKYWPDFRQIFSDTEFVLEDHFLVGRTNRTLVVLTDHFVARSMNGKWDDLVATIRRHTLELDGMPPI
jgi:hypothetical protein